MGGRVLAALAARLRARRERERSDVEVLVEQYRREHDPKRQQERS